MRKSLIVTCLVLAGLAGMFVYFRWSSAIRQPLNFSHSQHVRSNIDCATCHEPGTVDASPGVSLCSSCHKDMTFPQRAQWIKVYRVAPDIIFSHTQHTNDTCATCHKAQVAGQRWIHESRFTMDFCMKCHQERQANNTCGACHKNRK